MAADVGRPEDDWLAARLIPATGIKTKKDQEERATSALLSVIQIVPSFGKAILGFLGAPAGRITAFIEPRFNTDEGGTARPDGAIIVERGKTRWVCLIEVKTGDSVLTDDQVDRYLSIANRDGFDAVLTISNQIVANPSDSPAKVDKRRLRRVVLRHLSWFRVLTEAVIEHQHRGVSDPEQAWILAELIHYLDDERSGAGGYEGMPRQWVAVRNDARKHVLRPTDAGVREVAESWEQFLEYLSLRLHQGLGRPVSPQYPRGSTPASRIKAYTEDLGNRGRLEGSLKVPDTAGPIGIEADLGAQQVTTSMRIQAPRDGRPRTRINWLLRQLKDVPADLRVEVRFPRTRTTTSLLVADARATPNALLLTEDHRREPNAFDLALTRDMGTKAGKGKGSFVGETSKQVLAFYSEVVQHLKAWTPPAPRLVTEAVADDENGQPELGGESEEV